MLPFFQVLSFPSTLDTAGEEVSPFHLFQGLPTSVHAFVTLQGVPGVGWWHVQGVPSHALKNWGKAG